MQSRVRAIPTGCISLNFNCSSEAEWCWMGTSRDDYQPHRLGEELHIHDDIFQCSFDSIIFCYTIYPYVNSPSVILQCWFLFARRTQQLITSRFTLYSTRIKLNCACRLQPTRAIITHYCSMNKSNCSACISMTIWRDINISWEWFNHCKLVKWKKCAWMTFSKECTIKPEWFTKRYPEVLKMITNPAMQGSDAW